MSVPKKSQAGFSLMELLIAVAILAVGLLGLAQLQVTAMKTNSQSMTTTAVRAIAQKLVEDVAAMGPENSLFVDGNSGTWGPFTTQGGGTYMATYNVDQFEANGNPVTNVFNVTIRVESTTDLMHVLGAQKRTVTINTLKRAI